LGALGTVDGTWLNSDFEFTVAPSVSKPIYTTAGIFAIHYNITLANKFGLEVAINDTQILGNPFTTTVKPGSAFGSNCKATGTGLSYALTKQQETFYIQSEDRFGNLETTGGDSFEVKLSYAEKNLYKTTLTDEKNGTYIGSYVLQKSGQYQLSITLRDQPIHGSPFTIKCRWAGLTTGVIVLIGVSAICFIALVAVGVWLYKHKFKKRKEYTPLE